ncbi:methionine ABC transporter ATP-binding protein [Micromonospora globispora]|uniref:ABC transporter ATP-binding protein n=1 Tax=Micromonospora globispora TaxID=1450148 RepID=UPI000D6EB837|nr:ABC transporter ATP-binding protein [Micromonospora globispora]PWU55509.1 methionine ABC transporter ATP-binding protein [Micromonospora globispora]RQW91881.1 methionine ABC transporter ATP-binding protein [Micromonospora globispora]
MSKAVTSLITQDDDALQVSAALLEVRDLLVEFHLRRGVVTAVSGLSYQLHRGETLAIVGESGSGKTVAAQAVLGILTTPPARVAGGEVLLNGQDLLLMSESERRRIRGEDIALIAQNASLNPVFSVGWQIAEPFRIHRGMSHRDSLIKAAELLDRVGIPAARSRLKDYPHEFSGGMRQRVSIAMAMALEPDVLIADEPTTALDVTIQAQIMALLQEMQGETGMGIVLITHDLGLVSEWADRLLVMYAGRECETGTVEEIFAQSAHPYTRGLIGSIPQARHKAGRLAPIPGSPPDLMQPAPGCSFAPRCAWAIDRCTAERPELKSLGSGRASSCHRTEKLLHVGEGEYQRHA